MPKAKANIINNLLKIFRDESVSAILWRDSWPQ
jgi:hypothetical protein